MSTSIPPLYVSCVPKGAEIDNSSIFNLAKTVHFLSKDTWDIINFYVIARFDYTNEVIFPKGSKFYSRFSPRIFGEPEATLDDFILNSSSELFRKLFADAVKTALPHSDILPTLAAKVGEEVIFLTQIVLDSAIRNEPYIDTTKNEIKSIKSLKASTDVGKVLLSQLKII